MGVQPGSMNQ
jgi:hypothetical protein